MKKVLNILLAVLLIIACSFSVVACSNPSEKKTKTGLVYTKVDGNYEIVKFVDDGKTLDSEGTLTIEIEGVTEGIKIRKNAFVGNSTVKKIIVSSSVSEIEKGAFAKMNALEVLVVPFIGRFANSDVEFKESGSATASEKKAVDAERTIAHFFGEEVYDNGVSQTISYGAGTVTCYMPSSLNNVVVNASSTYSIPWCAFSGATKLEKISLLGDIDAIGENAFENTRIAEIKIPASVKTIHENAFLNSNVKSVKFVSGASVELLKNAFFGCNNLNYLGLEDIVANSFIDLTVFSDIEEKALDTQNGANESVVKTYRVTNPKNFDLSSIFGKTAYQQETAN